jgi:hypothetical protein
MPRVVFEPTIPEFEGAKAVHALNRAATVIGYTGHSSKYKSYNLYYKESEEMVGVGAAP